MTRLAVSVVSARYGTMAFFTSAEVSDRDDERSLKLREVGQRLKERLGRSWECSVDLLGLACLAHADIARANGWGDQYPNGVKEPDLIRWHSAGGRNTTGSGMSVVEIVDAIDALEPAKTKRPPTT